MSRINLYNVDGVMIKETNELPFEPKIGIAFHDGSNLYEIKGVIYLPSNNMKKYDIFVKIIDRNSYINNL